MNKNEKQELARRAVASKHWRWMDGAHWVNGSTDGPGDVFADGGENSHYPRFGVILRGEFFEQEDYNPCMPEEPLPDLGDPATQGCALAIIAEARGVAMREALYIVRAYSMLGYPEALVAALEATQ